ncbi:MAG TPA: glutamate-cysteine ligase family protein [Gemmatimonadota bacterium]|nr:glutamate-cysteine ligase family protein [Gemmatimonadota bacterium]
MGQEVNTPRSEAEALRRYTRDLLRDMEALEALLESDLIERGRSRIGVEQETFLVDRHWRPAPVARAILEDVDDERVVPELGLFNLEFNAHPLTFEGDCLRRLHGQLADLLERAHRVAREHGAEILLTGILPTLKRSDLGLDMMTPRERYRILNDTLTRMMRGTFEFYIRGTDELHLRHDSMMVEAANTSFQIHFQVDPEDFARLYNVAQAVTGPALAVAVNSPLLFGKRLWRETRIALFQQSIDTRKRKPDLREMPPRVTFGRQWVDSSILEIFREDVARFKSLFGTDVSEDPFEVMEEGRAPSLEALQLHNSTVYRWNRPCYGLSGNGRAHLRIENRVLPSGPTLTDEISNAAFWFGLLRGASEEYRDIREVMEFHDARGNFIAAAKLGLGATLAWPGGESGADRLVLERLLPLARGGLRESGIDADDIDRYLGVIERRASRKRTGASWLLESLAAMGEEARPEERLRALTGGTAARQRDDDRPVSEWELATLDEGGGWTAGYRRLEDFMTTDLLTVNEHEALELVANLMVWHKLRYVPVEDDEHRLVGLVTDRTLLRYLTGDEYRKSDGPVPVETVMTTDLVTASPETPTLEAVALMREQGVACLPVVQEGHLVGLVTERDFMAVAAQLLERRLEVSEGDGQPPRAEGDG